MESKVKGFLHAQGRKMVNENGEEVLLKGWGAGNWMNPEGFMVSGFLMGLGDPDSIRGNKISFPRRYDRRRSIQAAIRELCGSAYAEKFFPRWFRAYLGEGDIREMSRWGYNSIRLPLDASALLDEEPGIHFNEETFSILDEVLGFCEKYGIYAILDLHGTPGHSGVPCDNGLDNVPRLFLEEETFQRMLTLWEELARRYNDRQIVAAYELLNEPLFPAWVHLKDRLVDFYDQAIARIRKLDKKHMIILSGPLVGTDQSIFTKDFDPECHNWGYTFHGYHWLPEEASFQKYLETSYRLDVPCIHGEGREAIPWMPTYYEMLENYHVGYNLFCWKSEGLSGMENSPVTHDFPEGWEKVMGYIREGGARPTYQEAQELFDGLLELVKFENCHVEEAMFQGSLRRPGFTVGGAGYDSRGGENASFFGGWNGGNVLNYRLGDRMKLVPALGFQMPPAMMGQSRPEAGGDADPLKNLYLELSKGNYACYSVCNSDTACKVSLSVRVISDEAVLRIESGNKANQLKLPKGERTAETLTLEPAKRSVLKVMVEQGIVQIRSVTFQ